MKSLLTKQTRSEKSKCSMSADRNPSTLENSLKATQQHSNFHKKGSCSLKTAFWLRRLEQNPDGTEWLKAMGKTTRKLMQVWKSFELGLHFIEPAIHWTTHKK